jgi:molybdenum cofactor cytidylyltransferase
VAAVIAAVILAAGESARLGRPKQLLTYRGRTLLRHVVDCASRGGCDPVFVVLGARAAELRHELEEPPVETVLNESWRQGIGSSVRAGVEAVERRRPETSAVLLLTCDQPRITPGLVRHLCARIDDDDARMVACEYAGTVGVPALFHRSLFPELLALRGPAGALDIDRPEDFERLNEIDEQN